MAKGKCQETLYLIYQEFLRQGNRVQQLSYDLDNAMDTIHVLEDEIQSIKIRASQSLADVAEVDDEQTEFPPRKSQADERWIADLWLCIPKNRMLLGEIEDAWERDQQNPQTALKALSTAQKVGDDSTTDQLWFQLLKAAILCSRNDSNNAFPLVSQVLKESGTNDTHRQQKGIALYLQARMYMAQSQWLAAHWLLAKAQCTEGYHGKIQTCLKEMDRQIRGFGGLTNVDKTNHDDVPRYASGSPIEIFQPIQSSSASPPNDTVSTTANYDSVFPRRPTSRELFQTMFNPTEAGILHQEYGSIRDGPLEGSTSTVYSPPTLTPPQRAIAQAYGQRLQELARQRRFREAVELFNSMPKDVGPLDSKSLEALSSIFSPKNLEFPTEKESGSSELASRTQTISAAKITEVKNPEGTKETADDMLREPKLPEDDTDMVYHKFAKKHATSSSQARKLA
ncbi:MAG: hypothetical protein Q9227_005821 [Pyrenula ochraceoflavens]